MLDENWLRSRLRMAMDIESRDGVTELADGVWRLGDARREPVLLSRSLVRLWAEPAIIARVRVPEASIRVIAPQSPDTPGRAVSVRHRVAAAERAIHVLWRKDLIPRWSDPDRGGANQRRSLGAGARSVLSGLRMGDACDLVAGSNPLHRGSGGRLQVVVVIQGRRGGWRARDAACRPRERQAQ